MKKIFVVDTSVFIHDPDAIRELAVKNDGAVIVIPGPVINELDGLKSHASKGFKAREASRAINAYVEKGKPKGESLKTGIGIENGAVLIVDSERVDFNHPDISLERNNDSRIILTAMRWKDGSNDVVIITNDGNFRILANSCGVTAEMYTGEEKIYNKLYSGIKEIKIPDAEAGLFTLWHADGGMTIGDIPKGGEEVGEPVANQCCVFYAGQKTLLAIYKKEGRNFNIVSRPRENQSKVGAIVPKNAGQAFAYKLCFDEEIDLVTLAGKAGTGKTLMALLAGYQQMKLGRYDHILVYRAQVELGKEMGFLPGTLDEKIAPWKYPIIDSFSAILGREGKREMKEMFEIGSVSIEPINYIQGRTLRRAYVLIDEAQNIEPEDMKALITRAGEGTKIVLTGDVAQVRHPYLNSFSNGLTKVVRNLKGSEIVGHVTLTKSERSRLAGLAADLM